MTKVRHLLVLVLAIGALVLVSAGPAAADDDDNGDETGRPCGSAFDALEGDAGRCGALNLIFPPNDPNEDEEEEDIKDKGDLEDKDDIGTDNVEEDEFGEDVDDKGDIPDEYGDASDDKKIKD